MLSYYKVIAVASSSIFALFCVFLCLRNTLTDHQFLIFQFVIICVMAYVPMAYEHLALSLPTP